MSESGALNEAYVTRCCSELLGWLVHSLFSLKGIPDAFDDDSISDIFGSTAERIVQRTSRKKMWLIGEDILRVPYQALRNMENPPAMSDPDHYGQRYQGAEDSTYLRAHFDIDPPMRSGVRLTVAFAAP